MPLDAQWQQDLVGVRWPTRSLPEVMCGGATTLRALIREYLFISLFRACAESLASENASRLAAIERADKNIDELLDNLHGSFHRLRQSSIDEELFDVVSGFEALAEPHHQTLPTVMRCCSSFIAQRKAWPKQDGDRDEPSLRFLIPSSASRHSD